MRKECREKGVRSAEKVSAASTVDATLVSLPHL